MMKPDPLSPQRSRFGQLPLTFGTHTDEDSRPLEVVDLREVTSVDEGGHLLEEVLGQGAESNRGKWPQEL